MRSSTRGKASVSVAHRYARVVLVLTRALVALRNDVVLDCDETYNYLEPLHYLVHGRGMQTWEHGSAYALRSYAYLFMHAPVAMLASVVFGREGSGGRVAFVCVRLASALASALAEASLVRAVSERHALTGACLLMILASSSGMAVASTAMLPSSFAMVCVTASAAASLRGKHRLACIACVFAVVFGWPFSGIAAIPFGLYAIYGIGFVATLSVVALFTAISVAISIVCDSFMYSKSGELRLVSSVYNLLKYNVMSGKSNLYGVEDAVFYVKNLLLNFQLSAAFSIFAPVAVSFAVAVKAYLLREQAKKDPKANKGKLLVAIEKYRNDWRAMLVVSLPFPLVTAFFTIIPHKEERFLYMIYPCLALSASVTIGAFTESFIKLSRHVFKSKVPSFVIALSVALVLLGTMALSVSRAAALLTYYGAPAKIYGALPIPSVHAQEPFWPEYLAREFAAAGADASINVCVGAEWYRFPSSFHLPSLAYSLRFIDSGFDGALPMPFDSSKGGTAHTPEGLNDDNEAHPNQFIDPRECRFLVEADFGSSLAGAAERPSATPGEWVDVRVEKFVDPLRSPTLTRVLYIPGLSEKRNVYVDYKLKVLRSPQGRVEEDAA